MSIEKTPQGFVSHYAIPTPADPVEPSIECTITPLAVETVKQAGGKERMAYTAGHPDYISFVCTACGVILASPKSKTIADIPLCPYCEESATAELQAKCERLEGELAEQKRGFTEAMEENSRLLLLLNEQNRRTFTAESQLTSLQSQLAAKGEDKPLALPENFQLLNPQKNYVVDAVGAAKAMRFNGLFDENHALHLQLEAMRQASPSPSRPSGEEVERQLFDWLRENVCHFSPHNADAINKSIAAEARRIVEGK